MKGESLFSVSKNVLKLSYSNAEFKTYSNAKFKNFPGGYSLDPVSEEKKVCFSSPKIHQNAPTVMQNSKMLSSWYRAIRSTVQTFIQKNR